MLLLENEIANGLNVDDLTEFFDKTGHNLMVFADYDARRHVRKLANNFGVDFEAYVSFKIYIKLMSISCSTTT